MMWFVLCCCRVRPGETTGRARHDLWDAEAKRMSILMGGTPIHDRTRARVLCLQDQKGRYLHDDSAGGSAGSFWPRLLQQVSYGCPPCGASARFDSHEHACGATDYTSISGSFSDAAPCRNTRLDANTDTNPDSYSYTHTKGLRYADT